MPDDARRTSEYVHAEAFGGLGANGVRIFNIGYGFRYSEIQQRETFGCLELKVCLYDDSVASSHSRQISRIIM